MWYVIVIVAMFVMTKTLTMETLMKVTMSMKTMMATVQPSDTQDCLVMFSLFHTAICLYSGCSSGVYCIAASSLVVLYDLCIDLCSRHVSEEENDVIPLVIFAIMSNSSMPNCVVLEVALHDRSAITLSSLNCK